MKKIIAMVLISVTLILIVFAVGYTRVESTDYTKGVRISERTAVERINYTGAVEYADSAAQNAKGSGVVQALFFKNGDSVKAGDVILTGCETSADLSGGDLLSSLVSGSSDNVASLLEGGSVEAYTAPKDGVISGLDLEPGGLYMKGQSLFKVSGQESFQVKLDVSEKDISKVGIGQDVRIDCKALPGMLSGIVSNVGDSASKTSSQSGKVTAVKVTVAVDGNSEDLKPGYTADCSIVTDINSGVLLAPYSAVMYDEGGRAFVYASSASCVEKRIITPGREYSNGVEIRSGLKSGDIVVYDAAKVREPKKTVVSEVTVYAQ